METTETEAATGSTPPKEPGMFATRVRDERGHATTDGTEDRIPDNHDRPDHSNEPDRDPHKRSRT